MSALDKVMINTDTGRGHPAEIKGSRGRPAPPGRSCSTWMMSPIALRTAAKPSAGVVRNKYANLQATYRQHLGETRQAEANVSFYEREFKRQSDLASDEAAAESKVWTKRNDLDNARNRLLTFRGKRVSGPWPEWAATSINQVKPAAISSSRGRGGKRPAAIFVTHGDYRARRRAW